MRLRIEYRLILLGVALGVLAAFGVARLLVPDPRGLGTHEQLGLPPCTTALLFGIPCPTCGMTTAFSLMARGRVLDAFRTQPAGAFFSIAAAMIAVFCVVFAAIGKGPAMRLTARQVGAAVVAVVVIVIAAWIYKLSVALA